MNDVDVFMLISNGLYDNCYLLRCTYCQSGQIGDIDVIYAAGLRSCTDFRNP